MAGCVLRMDCQLCVTAAARLRCLTGTHSRCPLALCTRLPGSGKGCTWINEWEKLKAVMRVNLINYLNIYIWNLVSKIGFQKTNFALNSCWSAGSVHPPTGLCFPGNVAMSGKPTLETKISKILTRPICHEMAAFAPNNQPQIALKKKCSLKSRNRKMLLACWALFIFMCMHVF